MSKTLTVHVNIFQNATSFLIFWYMPSNAVVNQTFEYLPSIAPVSDSPVSEWQNFTSWISNTQHRFANLT